jgi:hypothetical protein
MRWNFSRLHTAEKHGVHWSLDVRNTLECAIEFPKFLVVNTALKNFNRSVSELESEIKSFLRAPWELCYFNLMEDDGITNVFDDNGEPITEQQFQRWMRDNHPDYLQSAYQSKPSDFLALYPTWGGLDGSKYPTDMFSAIFADPTQPTVELSQSHIVGDFLHRNKAIVLDLEPTMVAYSTEYKLKSHQITAAGREIDESWHALGLVPVAGDDDLYALGWHGTHRLAVWSEMNNFAASVSQMAQALSKLGRTGILVPFNFNQIPDNSLGYNILSLRLNVSLHVMSLWESRRNQRFPLAVSPDQDLSRLSYHQLKLSSVSDSPPNVGPGGTRLYVGSCFDSDSVRRAGQPSPVPESIEVAHRKLSYLIRTVHETFHAKQKVGNRDDIEELLTSLSNDTNVCIGLLRAKNNTSLEQSEGFMQLDGLGVKLQQATTTMRDRNIISSEQFQAFETQLDDVGMKNALQDAYTSGIYKNSYETTKRPLHEYEKLRLTNLHRQAADKQEHQENPKIPVGGLIALTVTGVFAFAAMILFISLAIKNRSGK